MAQVYKMRALALSDNEYVTWESSAPDPDGNDAPEAIVEGSATVMSIVGSGGGGGGGDETTITMSSSEVNDANPTDLATADVVLLDPTYSTPEYFPSTDDLPIWLKMNETSGTAYANSGTGSSNWTLNQVLGTQGVAAYIDKGYSFPTVANEQDYIQAPTDAELIGYDFATITVWVYLLANADSAVQGVLFSKPGSASITGRHFGINMRLDSAVTKPVVYHNGTQVNLSTATIPLTTWTHLALSYDGTNGYFYINGALVETFTGSGDLSWPNNTYGWEIGNMVLDTTRGCKCIVEDARVYNRALSLSEISAVYGSSTALTGLTAVTSGGTRRKSLVNVNATNYATITREDARSNADNQFCFSEIGVGLPPRYGVDVLYADGKWRKTGTIWTLE